MQGENNRVPLAGEVKRLTTQIIDDLRHTQEAVLEAEINTDLTLETATTTGRPDLALNPDLIRQVAQTTSRVLDRKRS
jgi:hypothetical protein